MKNKIVDDALVFIEDRVLPILKREPSIGSQILDYDFLLEFSERRSANPFSLLRRTLDDGLKKIRLFGHISQCAYHCLYCSFPTLLDGLQEEDAVRLVREASTFKRAMGDLPEVESLSIGGGTPTTLSAKGIGRLVKGIREHYQIPRGVYANMECSPDTITPEKVAAAHEAGITRLSMGVQTFNNEILERCERGHTGELAEKACKTLLQQNFQDLNVDLMRGLPGQTPEIFADDIEKFIETKIPSLHLYRLRLPPKHPLLRSEPYTRNYVRDVLAMQIIADRSLSAAGYGRHHSAHWTSNRNASTVTSKPWDFGKAEIGFGISSYSYVPMGEVRNVKSAKKWRDLVDHGRLTFHEGALYLPQEQEVRWIKFALKSLSLDLKEYERCFGVTIDNSVTWPKIKRLIDLGILSRSERELSFTPAGYAIAEEALRFLI